MRLKRLDLLILGSLIPPFIASFFVSLFVLVMQFLWLWIDEIIGKGIDTLIILELLGYLTVNLIPMAIPIAILISSVMVFGNLAENHELTAIKSAGVSLWRMMRMAVLFGVLSGAFSYVCSDFLVPIATLKYKTRLFDIKKQKPALSIEPGIFNYDFQGYTIYVKDKKGDNRNLERVLIYDYTQSSPFQVNMIYASRGEMYSSDNQRYLVMELYDGFQIQESLSRAGETHREVVNFIRTTFDKYVKKFDLSEFEISRSDETIFRSNQEMMNSLQLLAAIDTVRKEVEEAIYLAERDLQRELKYTVSSVNRLDSIDQQTVSTYIPGEITDELYILPKSQDAEVSVERFIDLFSKDNQSKLWTFATQKVQDQKTRFHILSGNVQVANENLARQYYNLHVKYSNGTICLVFIIIGAALGAIVRKGGYGYPLLIAIVIFMIFISLGTAYKKLAETLSTDPIFAAWAPVVWTLPLALVSLGMAQYDKRIQYQDLKGLIQRVGKLRRYLSKQYWQGSKSKNQ